MDRLSGRVESILDLWVRAPPSTFETSGHTLPKPHVTGQLPDKAMTILDGLFAYHLIFYQLPEEAMIILDGLFAYRLISYH